MDTVSSQHILQLYIHPDEGPIKPMTLDLMEIEIAVQGSRSAALNPDEERFRQIASRIKKEFPYVDPNSNQKGLSVILSRLSHSYHFTGVVLRLAGMITEDASSTSNKDVKQLESEVTALASEVPHLKRLLLVEQQAHRAAKEQYLLLEAENSRLLNDRGLLYERSKTRIEDLQEQVRQQTDELRRMRENGDKVVRENSALRIQIEQLNVEHGELHKHLESLKKNLDDLQLLFRDRESELARLRMEVRNAEAKEMQLNETIERQQEEIRELEDSLNSVTPRTSTTVGGSNQFEILPP